MSRPERTINARTTVIQTAVARADTSRQVEYIEKFTQTGLTGVPSLETPYDIISLSNLRERSNILPQCIDAYVTNIARYGFEIVEADPETPMLLEEIAVLQSFIDRPNSEESLTSIHAKIVDNKEAFGFAFMEVIRDKAGRVSILRHARSSSMRLRMKDPEVMPVTYDMARGKRVSTVTETRTFRKYMQIAQGAGRHFKEFGDPRRMNYKNGEFANDEVPVADEDLATEIIHFRLPSEDPYGVPRWVSQLPAMLGSREAEEGNLRYFEDNTVPPLMLTVAGGRLTQQSYAELTQLLQKEGIGRDRQHRILIVEAVPEREGLDDTGSVAIKLDKLTDSRQNDALFAAYDDANQKKVMSSFRLPGILVGRSDDHTYATANTAQFIAETQVFAPERVQYDEVYNLRLVNNPFGLNLKTVKLRSKAPSITNPEAQVKGLTAFNVMGAITPRAAVNAANQTLLIKLPQYPSSGDEGYADWMDQPLAIRLAGEKTQVGQAMKSPVEKQIEKDGNLAVLPEHGHE